MKICTALFAVAITAPAFAGVAAHEASQLGGPKLTACGAEVAGNADGSIPAYTGGLQAPSGADGMKLNNGPGRRQVEPYKGEKPILTINAANLEKYKDAVSIGIQTLMKRHPDFRIVVYPSHRSMYYPEWIQKNCIKNATTAHLSGTIEGDGVAGAYGGIPFPIPKNGYEAMWNHNLAYLGWREAIVSSWLVDSAGHRQLANRGWTTYYGMYYDPGKTGLTDTTFMVTKSRTVAPPQDNGSASISKYSINYSVQDQMIWAYTPGQRRVKLAPENKYDTPIAQFGGAFNFDEQSLFFGRMDLFNFKLIGKKEMYIPYNDTEFKMNSTADQLLLAHFPNPDRLRWEKHRVWIVEATLKPGARHSMKRRVFYLDEDAWSAVLSDGYDQSGNIYRVGVRAPMFYYAPLGGLDSSLVFFDLSKGNYSVGSVLTDPNDYNTTHDGPFLPASAFEPSTLTSTNFR
jgi:hypothetical protein